MGAEFVVNSLEEMCDLMCNNKIPGGKKMDRVIYDVRVYANDVVDRLNSVKGNNRDKLCQSDIQALNDAINLISHNIKEIVRE